MRRSDPRNDPHNTNAQPSAHARFGTAPTQYRLTQPVAVSERAALIKRHSVRLYAEELALARCNKSYEAYSRCADNSYSKTACFAPLEYFAACTRQAYDARSRTFLHPQARSRNG